MDEIWKNVPGYEGLYMVSNLGRIKSCKRATTSGKVLKLYTSTRNGYVYVSLCKDNKKKTKRVHILVMSAFCQRNKKDGYDRENTIDHKDGNKENNRLDNLEWCSQSENQKRAYILGINKKRGRKCIDLDTMQIFDSLIDAARSVGGNSSASVFKVCTGKRSNYKNHSFAFLDDYENETIPEYAGKYRRRSSETLWR